MSELLDERLAVADALDEFADIDEAEGGNTHVIATERRAAQLLRSQAADRSMVRPDGWMHPDAGWCHKDVFKVAAHCRKDGPGPIPLYAPTHTHNPDRKEAGE